MNRKLLGAVCVAALTIAGAAKAQDSGMTFFLATNPGKGGDLGGLTGADARCQSLAREANAGGKTWRAYLSTSGEGGKAAVNARDRIGKGPWRNAKGVVIAKDVEELHANPNINFDTALTAKGEPVNSRRMKPNYHDMLTGSLANGHAFPPDKGDTTCRNWTSGGEGSAYVGHHDREGLRDDASSKSWNSSHPSRGCSLEALNGTGGNGYFYCFAAN
ncbi:MAG TPA: hypothetical protein VGF58_13110 [Burkholderiales bacterium]|jgi:hypothetical protein